MDVNTTFLYAPLEEQPEGTMLLGNEGKVMRLLKCLYSLKQAPRQWNMLIDTVLKQLGFTRLMSDFGIYMKGEGEAAVHIAPYVDNLLAVGRVLKGIRGAKDGLCSKFKMKDLRRQDNGHVFLVQEQYARDVVKQSNMEGCKPVSTPRELGSQLE